MTYKEVLNYFTAELEKADIEFPDNEVYELIEKHTGKNRDFMRFNSSALFPEDKLDLIKADIEKRKTHYPLQYILGYWFFMGMKLKLKDEVLSPRDDTEVLCYEAIKHIKNNSYKGLDLCSGTGAVALGIISECKNAKIDALELYPSPWECLTENCRQYGENRVSAVRADVLKKETANKYTELDFIVSNPPYIKLEEMDELQTEVNFEPREALTDEGDGLLFYRVITENFKSSLKKGGLLAFEIGETEAEDVKNILIKNGFTGIEVVKDIAGLDRTVKGIKA